MNVSIEVKLHAPGAWLPGRAVSFCIVPLDPALKGGVKGNLPVTGGDPVRVVFSVPLHGGASDEWVTGL